ncbi:hypothetical protein EDB84DRAFT_960550 [Lactarius hengduanensis]|nr:hypothetical protein EDB84DRAFT_960550 [Lactarius hengduanensis]
MTCNDESLAWLNAPGVLPHLVPWNPRLLPSAQWLHHGAFASGSLSSRQPSGSHISSFSLLRSHVYVISCVIFSFHLLAFASCRIFGTTTLVLGFPFHFFAFFP